MSIGKLNIEVKKDRQNKWLHKRFLINTKCSYKGGNEIK